MKQVVAITIHEGDYIAKPEVGRHRIMCTDNWAAESASAPRFSSFYLAGGLQNIGHPQWMQLPQAITWRL